MSTYTWNAKDYEKNSAAQQKWARELLAHLNLTGDGAEGLGAWFNEDRDVYADYAATIGSAMPQQIVKVWFIAVSLFQRQEGRCHYADISFLSDKQIIPVSLD